MTVDKKAKVFSLAAARKKRAARIAARPARKNSHLIDTDTCVDLAAEAAVDEGVSKLDFLALAAEWFDAHWRTR